MFEDDFLAHVAWPRDQAQFNGGAGTSGAANMEEDAEDDDEDEEDDGSEDKEDNDEDSDDSRG